MSMRIGIFGGTFNPPHRGHVEAARAVQRQLGLDKILLIPAGLPPHKSLPENTPSPVHRLRMARLCAREIPGAEVSDIELARSGKSYTVDTVRELAGRYPGELSGGQRQRVGIARALAGEPDILLMDEPFGAVDGITRRDLQDQLQALWRRLGLTVVFVTHDIREALRLGSLVLVMEAGRIAQLAPPEELCAHPAGGFVRRLLSDR